MIIHCLSFCWDWIVDFFPPQSVGCDVFVLGENNIYNNTSMLQLLLSNIAQSQETTVSQLLLAKGLEGAKELGGDSWLEMAKQIFHTTWQHAQEVWKGGGSSSLSFTAWGLAGHQLGGGEQLLVHCLLYFFSPKVLSPPFPLSNKFYSNTRVQVCGFLFFFFFLREWSEKIV